VVEHTHSARMQLHLNRIQLTLLPQGSPGRYIARAHSQDRQLSCDRRPRSTPTTHLAKRRSTYVGVRCTSHRSLLDGAASKHSVRDRPTKSKRTQPPCQMPSAYRACCTDARAPTCICGHSELCSTFTTGAQERHKVRIQPRYRASRPGLLEAG